jgi:hypothetical protein
MTIVVVPTDRDVPLIQDVEGTPADIVARAEAFFKTAEFLESAGAEIEIDEPERAESRAIFNDGGTTPSIVPTNSAVAIHLKALINEYDHRVLESNIQARNYIVNRLLDISNPHFRTIRNSQGQEVMLEPTKPSEQLKALELLGKVSEIGLFTERIEVNINNKSTEELESELVETLTKYMGQAVPADPKKDAVLDVDLDEELGRV